MKYVQIPENTAKLIHAELIESITRASTKEHTEMLFEVANTLTEAMKKPVKKAGRPKWGTS
jgi:phage gpG-like protein